MRSSDLLHTVYIAAEKTIWWIILFIPVCFYIAVIVCHDIRDYIIGHEAYRIPKLIAYIRGKQ